MAENDIAIQVGVVLNTKNIGEQLANIKTDKNNSIKISANLDDVKKKVREYKESLGKESNAAKLLIDVLKGESDRKIKEYIDGVHERYVNSPIKITLDVDTQGTTANINKAVGEMQQQVQKAVDQASKSMGSAVGNSAVTTANSSLSLPSASGDTKYWNELNDAIQRYSSAFDDVSAKVASWRISEDMEGNVRAAVEFKNSVGEITTAIFRLQDALDAENKPILDENGNTIKEWVEVGNQYTKSFQAAEQAARKMYEELNKGYRESEKQAEQQYQMYDKMFAKLEQNAQRTSDYLLGQEDRFNKLYSDAFEEKNPLEGLYAKEAESALSVYKTEIEQIKSSGETITAEQKARIQQLHDYAQKVIEDQKRQAAEVRAYYNDLNKEYRQSEKQRSSDQQMYDKMLAQREQEFQKLADQMSKYEADFNNLYSGAFEQKNPLTGEFADKALDALQKYQDEYQNVMKAGTVATDEQKRKIEELHQAAAIAIKEQQSLQQQFNSDKRQDYSGLFGQSKEWEAALKQITDAENKLNEIQKNAFSGTNALTGDFAKEATRQIDEVKNKFAEIRKTAEESFGGAATVSKDALRKMVDDLKSDLDRLAKLEYPSDKLAAQNVDVKKAFAADALVEMEERLKSLGSSTTEYYNKIQDLKTILSTVGQIDSDPSAWAKFRNEFHMLEDEIKKFEASTQGMGQKLAAGLENNQLQQITEMIDRLNNIDEKFNGAGVERLQQSLQSLAQEYMNVIEQLQNPNLSKDEYDALANKVKDLSDQFNQARNAVKIFNDGFKNEGDLKKYEQSADALRMRFEQLQRAYANLANRNPEIADRFREVENAINGMDPKNIGEVSRQVGNLAKECGNASGQTAGLRGALTDAFGGLGSYLARFASSYYLISKTIQDVKKMVSAVKEVDTSLVEFQKVTNLTGDSLTQFTDKAYQMGARLGRTGKDVIDAATTFSRAGYDLNEATQLAQSALVMTNVGVDIPNMESAASDMISILKAFDIQAEESMDVIDKLYNVANKEPLDFGNITQMLVTAGGTLAQSGSSLEETMGLLTGAFATMRTSSVANGLLMISQRLRGLSEDGEAIDGLIPKLQSLFSSVGINIEDQNGELRSTFDILQDLAGVWDQLSSKQKQYFGEKVAGNRQVKTLNAIMQNWDVVADTIDKANNAQGEALKGNEMYMDNIKGRMTQLQSAFQELAKTTINPDFVKNITSAGTEVIKFATSVGGLVPILTTIIGLIVTIKGAKIAEGLGKIWTAFSTLFTGMSSGLSLATGWVGVLIAVAGAIAMIVARTNEANSALKKFEEAKESYEKHKSKVESLNDELETTQDRIEELEAKEHLTIIEQKELDRLKEVNTQLQTQIALEEKLAEIAQGQARDAATKIIEEENSRKAVTSVTGDQIRREISKNLTDDIIQDIVADSWKTMPLFSDELSYAPTNEEQVRLRMEAIKQDYAELVKIQEQIANLKPGHAAMKDELDAESDAIAENIKNNKEALSDYYNWLENKTEGIDYIKDAEPGSREARYNELLDFKKAIGDALLFEDAFNSPVDKILDDILSKYPEAIKEIQDQLKEASSEGWELDIPEDLAQELMTKLDLTMDEVKQLFEEKYGEGSNGLQLDIGPQMSINMEDVIGKLYQTTDGYTKVLSKALSEQEKAGALTAETLEKVIGESGLEGVAQCLERTADGYRLNTERVNEYISAQNEDVRLNAIAGIMERQIAIENLAARYGDLETAVLSEADAQNLSNWQNEIIQLQAIADNAIVAADALDALREASKTADEDADHTEGQGLLKKTQEKIDEGKLGTDDFRAGMDYLLGKDWYERFNGDLDKAIATFEAKRKKFFADDDADSALNFMNGLDEKGFAKYDKATGKITMLKNEATGADYTLEEIAKAFGISEDAARDLFELLNAYSFEDKFKFGDDVLDSADKIAVAEKKLQELDEQRIQKKKELEEAEKEYNKTTDEGKQKEKAAEIDELKKELKDLDTQYNDLATSIETANKALENDTKPPKTLEEALKQIQDYQQAIDTLEKNNITPTVELQGDVDTLKALLEPTTTLTIKAIDQTAGVLQNAKKDADELNDSDPTVDIKAEKDKSVDEVKDDLKKLPSPEELTAMYMADEDSKSLKTVNDLLDKIAKDREVKYKAKFEDGTQKTNEELWKEWEPKRSKNEISNQQFNTEYTPKVNETEFGKEFREALQTVEESAEPVEITPKVTEESWGQLEKEFDEAAEDPIKVAVEPEKTPEEIADEFTVAWGESWTQPFEIPIGTSVDEEEVTQEIQDAIEGMPPAEAPVDVDSNTLIGKIKDLIKNTKLGDLVVNVKQKVEKAKTTAPKDVTQTVNVKGKDAGGTKAVQDVQKEAEKGATVPVDADTKEARAEDKSLVDKIKEKVLKPVGLALGDITKQITELEKRLSQEVQKKIKITYEETNQKPYAKGTKKAEEGISLVDEKGAELIEHTKQGTFELGTNDGARLTHLDEGDVVHNAEETKKILSRMANAGGFFRDGLNKVKSIIGNAFATGVSGGAKVRPKKKKDDKGKKSGSTGSKSGSGSSSGSNTDSGSNNDEMSRWTEWAKQFFDWAEIKLNRLKEITKGYTEEAARAIGVWAKNKEIKKAMKAVRNEISATQKAYLEYMNTAAEIASRSGLSADIIKKIQNGTIDVSKYDDVTQQKIKDYQTWYEKAMACKEAIKQLEDQEKELAKQRLQNIVDDYTARARIYESDESVGAAQRDYNETLGKATKGTSIADKYLDSDGNILLDEGTYETSTRALEDALYSDIEIVDGFVDDYIDAFNKLEDYNLNLDLSPKLEEGKLLDGSLSPDTIWRKTEQEYGSFSDEIHSAEAKKEELEQARKNIQREFDAQVSQGLVKVGDDTWLEYTNKLKELDKDILQTGADIERLKDQANDAAFIPFRNQMGDFTYEAGKATQEMELGNVRGSLGRSGKRDTYEKLIDNAESQNKNLKIQNELYKQLQEGLDVNSQKYQDLEQKIRDNETAMLANEEAVEKYKQAITQLGFDRLTDQLNDLTRSFNDLDHSISVKMLKGIELTESAYQGLIQNGREQINNLVNQKNAYKALMDALVAEYGEEAKTSDLYLQYQSQIDSLDESVRGLEISILQWQDSMENLRVEKLGWQIDKLKSQADALSDALSLKESKGFEVYSSDYQKLIDNADAQRRAIQEQNSALRSQQVGMDVNSQAYQDLQSQIDDNEKSMRSLDAATVEWKKEIKNIPVKKLGWDLDTLEDSAEKLADSLSLKELKGIEVKDADYNSLINNANARRNTLLKQNAEFISQQEGMDRYSDEYQELAEKIRANEKEMRQLDEATVKWKKDMNALKVQKLAWQLDELNASLDRINNLKSLNEVQGYDQTASVYKSLIDNSMRRIELLKQENSLLQKQQVGMDKNSDAYQELQKQIVDNNNEIDNIKISQEEWNDNIIDIGISNIQKYRDSLSKSNEQLQRQKDLQQAIQDLEKADSQRKVRTYVEGQGFVYQRDEEEFKKAQENLEDVIKDQLLDKLDDLIDALEESKKDSNVYDRYGNLLGSVYNTPQLGNLANILENYYRDNNNAAINVDVLKDALGKNVVSNINPQNKTTFSIGDIVINEVKDGNELAKTIVDQFPNALLQALYSKN